MVWLLKLLQPNGLRLTSFRHYSQFKSKLYQTTASFDNETNLDGLIKKIAPKLIFNSVVESCVVKYQNSQRRQKRTKRESEEPLPLTLKYLSDDIVVKRDEIETEFDKKSEADERLNFPYTSKTHEVAPDCNLEQKVNVSSVNTADVASQAHEEVQNRYQQMKNWMVDYDNYDDTISEDTEELDVSGVNYGTPDPKAKISNVPCGGCGALLHCKDTAIPGYIPSEIFKNAHLKGGANLEAITCQRCHFLKNYNLALQVQVTPEDYPKVLASIKAQQGLVILMVDLLDFPCSIWPGIGDIFGHKMPIVVVGNKVDLLPQDAPDFLKHLKKTLLNMIKLEGFATFNIKEVALISAKTGYGVEDLITRLNTLHKMKGDVYIVGCTNVGKSSLFNALLQSDFCKTQAIDLIQRATTSVWPGTTLNLLKFPIKRPVGYRQYLRNKRLMSLHKIQTEEDRLRKDQLRSTKNPRYASLVGHIDVTRNPYEVDDDKPDLFAIQGHGNASGKLKMGINETSMDYAFGKWCFDTPGVVQPDQLIHLLTTEELLLTLPKELILPRTFCLKPNSSLFIAGLARLDYLFGDGSVRLTVFASNELPITVCDVQDAEEVYRELLGTDLFKVPTGNNERLSKWPPLEIGKSFKVTGIHWRRSANDVVLSSAGWIAITGRTKQEYNFQAWTPEKRGVYVRDCLLPDAVGLTGARVKHSVAYNKFRFYLK